MDTKFPNHVFYVWLVDLQAICAKYGLETWFSPNDDLRKYLLYMKHGWTKNAFWDVNNNKLRKWCQFFHLFYLITILAYICSQWTPSFQIKYFMFDWSFYRLIELNTGWERDFLQMKIFVNVCSTWSMVEFKTRFETWITINDVIGLS
jgi:hypothetical protein